MPHVAIIGCGLIGRSWATVFARGGWAVALHDPVPGAADEALKRSAQDLRALAAAGLADDPETALGRVRCAAGLEDALAGAALVQESGPENPDAKTAIFADLDRLAPADAILASSTSTIVASAFTESLAGRGRCLVAHPVNPPHLVPLVELVGAPWTSPGAIAKAQAIYEEVGQVPIVVRREIEGFVLNRLQAVLLSEALRLVEDGYASPQDIDKAVKDGLGLRWSFMGPFATIELNAPGGMADYLRRYGPGFTRISAADPAIYRPPLTNRVLDQWGEAPSAARIAERMQWRDGRLAALRAHKRAQPS